LKPQISADSVQQILTTNHKQQTTNNFRLARSIKGEEGFIFKNPGSWLFFPDCKNPEIPS
jgi:hypothetical protein